jgi:hypothetical protein
MQDRRHSQRRRTLRAGRILFNNRRSVISCTVRNISNRGACLLLPSVVDVPQVFDLRIEGESASRLCKMIWYSHNRIGVEFTS